MKTYTLRSLWTELHAADDSVVSAPQYYPYSLSADAKGDLLVQSADPDPDSILITVTGPDPAVDVVLYADNTRTREVYRVPLRFEAPPASLVRIT